MRISLRAKTLRRIADHLHRVASQDIRTNFALARRITIRAHRRGRVSWESSNGTVFARVSSSRRYESYLVVQAPGTVTVNSLAFSRLARALCGRAADDHEINIMRQGRCIVVQDAVNGQSATIETMLPHHEVRRVQLLHHTHELPADAFQGAISCVSKYISDRHFKPRYQMLCIDFVDSEVRFIAGDGMRFAIMAYPRSQFPSISGGVQRYVLPAKQMRIVAKLASTRDRVLVDGNEGPSPIVSVGHDMTLQFIGLHALDYAAYDKFAYRDDDAIVVLDVPRQSLADLLNDIACLHLPKAAHPIEPYGVTFRITTDGIWCAHREGRRTIERRLPGQVHFMRGHDSFASEYAYDHLVDIASVRRGHVVRFHLIDPAGVAIARLCDTAEPCTGGPPQLRQSDNGSHLRFFFAALVDDGRHNAEGIAGGSTVPTGATPSRDTSP